MNVKVFCVASASQLEESINDWLDGHVNQHGTDRYTEIIDIKFSSTKNGMEAMIIYKVRKNGGN